MVEVLYDRMEAKSSALKQAMEVQASLPAESPSFIKTLVRSNVTGGYWLVSSKLYPKVKNVTIAGCQTDLFLLTYLMAASSSTILQNAFAKAWYNSYFGRWK